MRTILYDKHLKLQAKMTDFGGWEMPLHYPKGIVAEYRFVRESAGLFDVSHMGRIGIAGKDAERLIDYISTNKVLGKQDLSVTYTLWCNDKGGVIDDLLVFKISSQEYFVVANAGNRQKDLDHLTEVAKGYEVQIIPYFEEHGILALQGANALSIIEGLFPETQGLGYMHFLAMKLGAHRLFISRTGYTGSPGVEIYADRELTRQLWDQILLSVEPVGLGARDLLRLEMGYALYGHELSDAIVASETISSWAVKLNKSDFLGKSALVNSTGHKKAYALVMNDGGIPRQGYQVHKGDERIGEVTSGTFSPVLNKGIALILSEQPLSLGEEVLIQIRGQRVPAIVSKTPFINICPEID